MTLEIGDVISTGTPLGVGMGQKLEPIYLKTGQQIRLGVEGLGEQEQKTVFFTDWFDSSCSCMLKTCTGINFRKLADWLA